MIKYERDARDGLILNMLFTYTFCNKDEITINGAVEDVFVKYKSFLQIRRRDLDRPGEKVKRWVQHLHRTNPSGVVWKGCMKGTDERFRSWACNECTIGANDHALLASSKHDVDTACIVQETKFLRPNKRDYDIIILIT